MYHSRINIILALLLTMPIYAETKKEAVKSHLKQHFQVYGFVCNYFAYDSRESMSGMGDLFNYQPYDENWNNTYDPALRQDLNAQSTFRFLSITTRVGLDVKEYKWRGTEFGAKIEADFYAGLSGTVHKVSGTAILRLRQAYVTFGWDSLSMGKDFARVDLLVGQAWHPLANDKPDVIALNTGAPFAPFSRTPQVKMDARLGQYVTLTGVLLWQMQYASMGPKGASAEYIGYSKTPEAYAGVSFHTKGFLLRAGADVLSICPRQTGTALDQNGNEVMGNDGSPVQIKVSDRLTTVSPFVYVQYQKGDFSIKAKSVFAEAGEHLCMNGGYGIKEVLSDGSYAYTPTRTSSSWISIAYGGKVGKQEDKHPQKLQGLLFGGYVRNFGTKDPLATKADGTPLGYYYPRTQNLNRMWRLTPALLYTVGMFQFGCEYEITSVQYGRYADASNPTVSAKNGLVEDGLHWVTNHRVQLMVKFNF